MTVTSPPPPSPPALGPRLTRGPFILAVVGVYALSFFSQTLLSPPVIRQMNVWAFVAAQIVLIWGWVVLHRRRLRDAGRPTGLVIGIAAIYVLEIVLLVLLIWLMLQSSSISSAGGGGTDTSIFQLFVIIYLLALMTGDSSLGALQSWMVGFTVVMLLPVAISLIFSVWTATRPSAPSPLPR